MTFGLKKCGTAHMRAGRVVSGGSLEGLTGNIREVDDSTYKYLGVAQIIGARRKQTRKRVTIEYLKRVRKTWKTALSAKAMVAAHNSWCASVPRYYYGALRWTRRDLLTMDRATHKIMSQNKAHHRGASLERPPAGVTEQEQAVSVSPSSEISSSSFSNRNKIYRVCMVPGCGKEVLRPWNHIFQTRAHKHCTWHGQREAEDCKG